ncbi:hypothetical protein HY950_00625 [Candidatus Gottesmanbacteria bacterium]|nr:hypothetical protein [Candidatus Gottesmanbacteria bacterium]
MERFAYRGHEAIQRRTFGATRCVARVLVGESLLHQSVEVPAVSRLLEAAVPANMRVNNGHGEAERLWMLLGAVNSSQRRSPYSVDTIVEQVDNTRGTIQRTPLDRVRQLRSEGYRFIRGIPTDRVDEVLDLWRWTFDWNREGVVGLQERLIKEHSWRSSNRGVWFTGLIDPGTHELVSIATAERLNMPIGDGRTLPIVESTEWRRSDGIERHGFMVATVSHLHAQILEDLDGYNPLIIAETNFWSEAHRAGFAAAMDVAPRRIGRGYVSQALIQNVRVGDGRIPDGIRDFTMMYLPVESQNNFYDPISRTAMLREGVL